MALAPSSYGQGDRLASAIRPVLETLERRTLLSVSLADGVVTIEGTPQDDHVVVRPGGKDRVKVLFNDERHVFDAGQVKQITFDGGDGDDTFKVLNIGGSVEAKIVAYGGAGDDVLGGGSRNDRILGGDGDDLLAGYAGKDSLDGGDGNDTLLTGDGDDRAFGGIGDDQIVQGGGKDYLRPGAGDDEVSEIQPSFPIITYTLDPAGYTPRMQRYAYGLGALDDRRYTNRGQGQAIAIVGAFDLPRIRQDMKAFARDMDLPGLNRKQLRVLNMAPKKRRLVDEDWNGEAMLDVQWAHAIAPKARIYMVQAATNAPADMFAAVEKAKRVLNNGFGGGVISMSWGNYIDAELRRIYESTFRGPDSRFISYIASSGDIGGINAYPNTSPNVVSVGGTALYLDEYGNRVGGAWEWPIEAPVRDPLTQQWVWGGHHFCLENTGIGLVDGDYDRNIFPGGEVAWWEGSGGPSNVFDIPDYQENRDIPGDTRGTPDISWNADPATGVPVYNSVGSGGQSGWGTFGGTSAGAPQFAGVVALANQRRAERGNRPVGSKLLDRIYRVAGRGADQPFLDIGTPGGSQVYHGSGPIAPCDDPNLFVLPTFPGWDYATGWGSPNGSALIPALADERVPLTSGRIRISGTFTDELLFGGGTEWVGFTGTTRAGGFGTITVPAMTSTRLFRSAQVPGGGVTPVTNSLFMVDFFGHDSQDGRADRNGWIITTVNGVVQEQQLNQGTGTPLKLYKHGKSVQGLGFVSFTEITLTDDDAGGELDPEDFDVRTVPVRFVGTVGKKGQISGDYWAIGPDGERIERSFDPNSNLGTTLVRGKFRWD